MAFRFPSSFQTVAAKCAIKTEQVLGAVGDNATLVKADTLSGLHGVNRRQPA
jgi:hypothetical protein